MTEHILDRARRLWKEAGGTVPNNEVYDTSGDIDQKDFAPIDRPQNLDADFELAVRGFVEANRPHRVKKLIASMIRARGLETVRAVVSRSSYEDIVLQQAGDLL